MTRPTNITGRVVASAAINDPTLRAIRTATITFSLPTMSPTRPRIGVAMAALSRYAVSSQLAPLSDVWRVCSSWGMAGRISDCSRLKASAAVPSTAKVTA